MTPTASGSGPRTRKPRRAKRRSTERRMVDAEGGYHGGRGGSGGGGASPRPLRGLLVCCKTGFQGSSTSSSSTAASACVSCWVGGRVWVAARQDHGHHHKRHPSSSLTKFNRISRRRHKPASSLSDNYGYGAHTAYDSWSSLQKL